MDERRALHALRESDHILCTDDVRAQAAFERRVERDVTGRVDDDVDIVRDRLGFFVAVAEVCLGDVAAFDDNFVANETFERTTIKYAERIKRRRGDDVVPEALSN